MRTTVALAVVLTSGAVVVRADPAGPAEIDLFPKQALQKEARTDTVELPADSPWRSVERKAFGLFAPSVAAVTDETPPQILARQLARKREPAPHPPDRAHEDSQTPMSVRREEQVDLAQAAYEEPVAWQTVEIEVRVDDKGAPLGARIVHGSGRPKLDAAALDAVRRAVGATDALGQRGAATVRLRVEAGVTVNMPARAVSDEIRPRPKGAVVPLVRGRFGGGRKTELSAPLQPHVRTRVTIVDLKATP